MQKKLIVLALASAFAAPAFAATSNVDIYGQLDVSVDYLSGLRSSGTFLGNQSDHAWRINSNTSRFGLKGSEDLGGGLAAIWQIEQGINLDGSPNSNQPATGQGGIASGTFGGGNMRNTFLGVKSDSFGTVLAGTHDTPYKLSTGSLDPFADTAGDYNAIVGAFAGFNTSDLRLGNVLAYISPNFSGITVAVADSFMKETGRSHTPAGGGDAPSAYSGMVNYANGPLYLAAGYEKANNVYNSIAASADIRSWKLGAGYTIGNATINAIYDNIRLSDISGGTSSGKRSAWGLNGVYNMGNIALKAGFYHAGKVNGNLPFSGSDTGASLYELGGDYNMSKRTKLYLVYAHTNNDSNAIYCTGGAASAGFGASGVSLACGGQNGSTGSISQPGENGQDSSIFSLGMRHTF